MTTVHFHVDPNQVPSASSNDAIHVYLYGSKPVHSGTGCIGNQAKDEVERLGVAPRRLAMDFLSISLAVTAADTFVLRASAENSWSRTLDVVLPLSNPQPWLAVKSELQKALGFLTGDSWRFDFVDGGRDPPTQFEVNLRRRGLDLSKIDRVSLFSGGLDSGIAMWQMLKSTSRPLAVSHAYDGDASYQDRVSSLLPREIQRFSINASPERSGLNEISMRSRSFNFLAFGTLAADTLSGIRGGAKMALYVPENGLIALNAPLTPRRIGALSTRTTHPYFLSSIQDIVDRIGLRVRFDNPFETMTKGEMVSTIAGDAGISEFMSATVSCGNWRRSNKQCGRCVPCLIRRASLYAGNVDDLTEYASPDLSQVMTSEEIRDDLIAVMVAILRLHSSNHDRWVAQAGPLPKDPSRRAALIDVHRRGLEEVGVFLRHSGFSV